MERSRMAGGAPRANTPTEQCGGWSPPGFVEQQDQPWPFVDLASLPDPNAEVLTLGAAA